MYLLIDGRDNLVRLLRDEWWLEEENYTKKKMDE
jgi:hypothetical protein